MAPAANASAVNFLFLQQPNFQLSRATSRCAASITRRRVWWLSRSGVLNVRDTVAVDTPASFATSLILDIIFQLKTR